jgi:hypothetical protein
MTVDRTRRVACMPLLVEFSSTLVTANGIRTHVAHAGRVRRFGLPLGTECTRMLEIP